MASQSSPNVQSTQVFRPLAPPNTPTQALRPRAKARRTASTVAGLLLCVAVGMPGLARAEEAEQYYDFFSRAADLGPRDVWTVTEFSEGEYTLDMNVKNWDAQHDRWTGCKEDTDCNENAHQLDWGIPVYAPADGYIRQCARNFDDNPRPGESAPGRLTDPPTIYGGGNHVFLATTNGSNDVILLAHMQKGSIPASVCPITTSAIQNIEDTTGSYRTEMFLPEGSRPFVRRGQFLGRIGNSGASSSPHMHIHIDRATGPNTQTTGTRYPIPFKQVYAQAWFSDRDARADQWYTLEGDAITASGTGHTLVRPAPFLRRSDNTSAGAISAVDTVFLSNSLAVTAVRNVDGNLQLISWTFSGATGITRRHDVGEGAVSLVKIAKVNSSYVLIAVRDAANNLKQILYFVSPLSGFLRIDDYTAGTINQLDMTEYGSGAGKKVVTAVRDSDNNLKLVVWGTQFDASVSDYRIVRLGDVTEGSVSSLAITGAINFNGVVVAVRTASGMLKVIPYRISSDGMVLTRGDDAESGPVGTKMDLVAIPQGVVVAARGDTGKLRVLSYETSPGSTGGDIVSVNGNMEAGTVSEVSITRTPHAGSDVITAVRDSAGELLLVAWKMDADGRDMRRGGSIKAGAISKIATAGRYRLVGSGTNANETRDMLLTAVRDGSGELTLINWDVNLKN